MKSLTVIIASIIFGGMIGYLIALFDGAYGISEIGSTNVHLSTLAKTTLSKDEIHGLLFYGAQIFLGGAFGALTAIGALALAVQNKWLLVAFVIASGLLRGAVNFFIAYNFQIAMLSPGDANNISTGWRNVIILTSIHLLAGSLICLFSVWLTKPDNKVFD